MSWSRMFEASVVVFGCGNVLFGDDGLAPRVAAHMAELSDAALAHVAFIDAGTSIRPLLMDVALHPAPLLRRVIVLDVVQQEARAAGSIMQEYVDDPDAQDEADPAGVFLHHAPTWGLLRTLRHRLGVEVVVLTVQAAHIPEFMDDALSAEAQQAFPQLVERVRHLCCA